MPSIFENSEHYVLNNWKHGRVVEFRYDHAFSIYQSTRGWGVTILITALIAGIILLINGALSREAMILTFGWGSIAFLLLLVNAIRWNGWEKEYLRDLKLATRLQETNSEKGVAVRMEHSIAVACLKHGMIAPDAHINQTIKKMWEASRVNPEIKQWFSASALGKKKEALQMVENAMKLAVLAGTIGLVLLSSQQKTQENIEMAMIGLLLGASVFLLIKGCLSFYWHRKDWLQANKAVADFFGQQPNVMHLKMNADAWEQAWHVFRKGMTP